ncbi:MAG: nodulation protein NfeD [Spirochaetales bacterium]|nr:nodulation protein NfeD [Spirochaetales bacterium]
MKRTVIFMLLILAIQPLFGDGTFIIPIHGDIEPFQLVFLRRGIQSAEDADRIIFDINTFGGRVDTALKIATLIGSLENIETISYISAGSESLGVSWSAGALISFSCNTIYMATGTSMGAAAPVYQTQEGMAMAEEKTVSAVRAQMAALAEKNDYPKAAALGMVDEDLVVQEVFHDGQISLALGRELEHLKAEAEKKGVSFEAGLIISPEGKLLTLTAGEMARYHISRGTVNNREELLTLLGIETGEIIEFETSFTDKLVAVITSAAVGGLILTIGLLALYMEITSPGFGVPGTIAIICFAIVFGGGALMGTLGSLELLLFLLGVVLLVVEIFLIPGFGITGISGIILIAASLILSRQDFIFPSFEWEMELFLHNILLVLGTIGASIIIMALILVLFPHIRPFRRMILITPESQAVPAVQEKREELIAGRGITLTPLRPSGKAVFQGEVLQVEADGEFLETGMEIVVIEQSGNVIKVKKG